MMKLEAKYFEPIDHRVLVQPGPIRKLLQTMEVPDDEKIKELHKNRKEKDPIPETPFKTVKERVRTNYRIGQVLRSDPTDDDISNGEWIVYSEVQSREFDLLSKKIDDQKAPVLLSKYDVIMKLTAEAVDELGLNK